VGYTVRGGQEGRCRAVGVVDGVWSREKWSKVGGGVGG